MVYEAGPAYGNVLQLPPHLAPKGVDELQPLSTLDEGGEALTKGRGLDEGQGPLTNLMQGPRGGGPLGRSLAFTSKKIEAQKTLLHNLCTRYAASFSEWSQLILMCQNLPSLHAHGGKLD